MIKRKICVLLIVVLISLPIFAEEKVYTFDFLNNNGIEYVVICSNEGHYKVLINGKIYIIEKK